MTIRIPDQTEITFEPSPPNAVLVTISGEGGTLEDAGFIDGDVIVAIGEESIAGVTQLRGEASKAAAQQAKLSVQVLRNGRDMRLDVDPDVVLNNQNRKGRLDSFQMQ